MLLITEEIGYATTAQTLRHNYKDNLNYNIKIELSRNTLKMLSPNIHYVIHKILL